MLEYQDQELAQESEQKSFSFDEKTIINILKGARHALFVSAALGLLDYALEVSSNVESDNFFMVAIFAWFTQIGYQTIRQYIKGK